MEFNPYTFKTAWGSEVNTFNREGTNDWNTLYSCLVDDEYKLANLTESDSHKKIAVDIGGHIGGCTIGLLSLGYRVITVEPMPENAAMITKNAVANSFDGRLKLHQRAIASVNNVQVVLRYGSENTESGRHHRFIGNTVDIDKWTGTGLWNDGREILVETITIDEILKDVDYVDFLKIDCEGAEWTAFSKISQKSLAKIQRIAAELHPAYSSRDIYQEFNDLIGNDFEDVSEKYYGKIADKTTIGLAYFER